MANAQDTHPATADAAQQPFGLITIYVIPAYRQQTEEALKRVQAHLSLGTLSLSNQAPPDGSEMLLVASRYNLVNLGRDDAHLRVRLSRIHNVWHDLERLSGVADSEIGDVVDTTVGNKTIDVFPTTPFNGIVAPKACRRSFFNHKLALSEKRMSALDFDEEYSMSVAPCNLYSPGVSFDSDEFEEVSADDLRDRISGLVTELMVAAKRAHMKNDDLWRLVESELRGKIVLNSEGISPVTVNCKDEIILPDYNEMEILKGKGLRKTLYFFFLLHPEGVRYGELSSHREELERIYSHLWPSKDDQQVREAIAKAVTRNGKGIYGATAEISKINKNIMVLFPHWRERENPYVVNKDVKTGRYRVNMPADKISFANRNWFLTGRG